MLYANVSKGFKAGSFPLIGASNSLQYIPAKQESVLAYEAGVKTTQLNRTLQLTGAVFYYDYSNKQIFGVFDDPVFGALKREVNIPKSEETGAELQATWLPIPSLTVSGGVTYLRSEIEGDFLTQNIINQTVNVRDEHFPFTPAWQGMGDTEYRWGVNDRANAFAGASVNMQGGSYAELGELSQTRIDSYALLDLRAGLRSSNDKWSITLWGKNMTNKYYWSDATLYHQNFVRFTGMPRTYGATFSIRLQ